MSRWVLTGGAGMFGTDLVDMLRERGEQVTALGSADCDIRNVDAVRARVKGADVVVNCAAYTAVDNAESDEAAAFAINATGARNVALAAAEVGARMVQISTDYVFAGDATTPYGEDALTAPRSAYGRTKAAGEWAVRAVNSDALIVRTAWLYGKHGPNFVATMLRLADTHETLNVVDDQRGQPTWTRDLARYVIELVQTQAAAGIYHGTSEGETSWHGFTRAIFTHAGLDPQRVLPTTSDAFPRPAPRPANSVLAHSRGPQMPTWEAAIAEYLAETLPEESSDAQPASS